jgi:hypothetical protein
MGEYIGMFLGLVIVGIVAWILGSNPLPFVVTSLAVWAGIHFGMVLTGGNSR